jgi:sulfatase modifying factor 1
MRCGFLAAWVLLAAVACSRPPLDTTGMIHIESGEFVMGTNDGLPYEGPTHTVRLDSYWMDETEVTNRQFAQFVEQTDLVTTAEKIGDAGIFSPEEERWNLVKGADWRHPDGRTSTSDSRMDMPVVHVSWSDANMYCTWAGKRLPSEAEFEYAARGGLEGNIYAWGNEFTPSGKHQANTWQGEFPRQAQVTDGHAGLAAVKSYPPNGYGLYDMAGNVWEWTNDWYDPNYYRGSPVRNPPGPLDGSQKVQRGGSWLCSANYCQGYRVASRMFTEADSGLNNLGFRCVGNE